MTETLPRFEDILEIVSGYNPECDEDLLRRAYVYSAMAHRGQVRVSGEPYLVHPLEVARILAEMRQHHRCDGTLYTGPKGQHWSILHGHAIS